MDRSVGFAPLGRRLSEGPGRPIGAVPDKAVRRQALARHRPPAARAAESVSRSGLLERIAFHGELESKGLTKRAADARCPPEPRQRASVNPRVLPRLPVVPSNGRAPDAKRRGPTGIGAPRRLPGRRSLPAPLQDPSPPSRPTCAPSRRLLVLLPQQQVDALSDEGRGVPVSRVRDQPSHPVPRSLIQAEADDSRLSCHSLSSFA